jgi:hypothetical protein
MDGDRGRLRRWEGGQQARCGRSLDPHAELLKAAPCPGGLCRPHGLDTCECERDAGLAEGVADLAPDR